MIVNLIHLNLTFSNQTHSRQIERDTFADLSDILSTLELTGENETYKNVIIKLELNSYNPTIGELMNITLK